MDLLYVVVVALTVVFACAAIVAGLEKAKTRVAGHIPGAGLHGRGGRAADRDNDAESDADKRDRLIRRKRELLEAWAKDGRTIDIVTEAHAELVALEIEERGNAWRNYTAAAASEPLGVETPFERLEELHE
jgi:hypothetical protein